jgi:hypothetical protein
MFKADGLGNPPYLLARIIILYKIIKLGKLLRTSTDTDLLRDKSGKEVKMKLGFIMLLDFLIQKYKNKVPELELLELYLRT